MANSHWTYGIIAMRAAQLGLDGPMEWAFRLRKDGVKK